MRILTIHNSYQQPGGEDAVFEAESKLLKDHGHVVDRLLFDNSSIQSRFDRLSLGISFLFNTQAARVLARKIESFEPDVIHVHNFFPLASPSVFYTARRFRVPVVVTIHNYRLLCPSATLFHKNGIYEKSLQKKFPLDAVWRGVYRNSRIQTAAVAGMTLVHNWLGTWKHYVDRYIVLTNFAKNVFAHSHLNIDLERFIVKPNFVLDYGAGEGKRENYFLFVGRLSVEKGIHVILEAAKKYRFEVKIVGDGPLRSTVEQYTASCSNISFLGYQGRAVINRCLQKCKALIFPSICFETFGMSIIEAFSAGTPVIGSRLGAMQELIASGVNGLHFEAGNAEDLIAKIKQFNADTELQAFLRRGARQSYDHLYGPDQNYRDLIRIYNHAIRDHEAFNHRVKNKDETFRSYVQPV